MNIAILTDTLNSHSGSRAPIELAKALASTNRNNLTLYIRNNYSQKNRSLLSNRIKLKFIERKSFFKTFFSLLRDFDAGNYDIICSNATISVFLPAALSNKPSITTYHGTQ